MLWLGEIANRAQSENGQSMAANPLKASTFTINNFAIRQSAWSTFRAQDDWQDFSINDDETNYTSQGASILMEMWSAMVHLCGLAASEIPVSA
jgi:hypothetical protein